MSASFCLVAAEPEKQLISIWGDSRTGVWAAASLGGEVLIKINLGVGVRVLEQIFLKWHSFKTGINNFVNITHHERRLLGGDR